MYNELLIQLEKRIQEAVETIEMYRLEIAELKEKNSELENQHQVWEDKPVSYTHLRAHET